MAQRNRIGLVGVGNMGAPMARCLARAEFPVMLYDANPAVTEPFKAETNLFTVAPDLPTLGAECRTVVTMLPDSKVVRAATMGAGERKGFAGTLAKGSVVVDMSSSYPIDTQKLGEELAAQGVGLVDAPVSGGVPRAVSGTLAIMVGGADEHVAMVEGALKAIGTIYRTGKLGSGHALKALNNYVSAAGLIATSEALVIGQKFGLDGQVMTNVLNASSGKNNTTENKVERYMLNHAFNSGFALALMNKDVGMANRLAGELGIPATELGFVSELLERVNVVLGTGADHTAVFGYIEDAANKTD